MEKISFLRDEKSIFKYNFKYFSHYGKQWLTGNYYHVTTMKEW